MLFSITSPSFWRFFLLFSFWIHSEANVNSIQLCSILVLCGDFFICLNLNLNLNLNLILILNLNLIFWFWIWFYFDLILIWIRIFIISFVDFSCFWFQCNCFEFVFILFWFWFATLGLVLSGRICIWFNVDIFVCLLFFFFSNKQQIPLKNRRRYLCGACLLG